MPDPQEARSAATPSQWDYADVLDGPWYVFREPRDEHRLAIKSGHYTILTMGDYFDGGGPLEDRLAWICETVNQRIAHAAPGRFWMHATPEEWDEWLTLYANRDDVAESYAGLLSDYEAEWVGWQELNEAILRRWSPAGLRYIKERAWKIATQDL